jgi:hypothetical protein
VLPASSGGDDLEDVRLPRAGEARATQRRITVTEREREREREPKAAEVH